IALLCLRTLTVAQSVADPTVSKLLEKGKREIQQSLPEQAIFDFSEALLMHPKARAAAELHGERAGAYVDKGKLDEAIADADETVRLDRSYFRGYQVRGRVYSAQGQFRKAMQQYDIASRLNPAFAQLHNNRGVLLSKEGNEKAALREFNKAVEMEPSIADGYINRATSYEALGRVKEALADYHSAILLAPGEPDTYYDRGGLYKREGKFDEAIADLDEYLRRKPADSSAYVARAEAFLAKAEYQKADLDIRKAEECGAQDSTFLNAIAWIRATCPGDAFRDGAEAVEKARRACEITRWKEPNCLDTLAAAYAEVGKFHAAIEYEKKAINATRSSVAGRQEMQHRLALYRQHRPYRDKP
ncbi:MAG: tetratricopeptide repeat protein, partial [Bryobacteraceae bacterium]